MADAAWVVGPLNHETADDVHSRIARFEELSELPQRVTRSDTRIRLLAAALEIFAKNGFEATTVRDLAAFVGIKAPAIYNHFKSKEDVLGQALLWAMHDFNDAVIHNVEAEDPVERLRMILRNHIIYQRENPMLARAFDVLSSNDLLERLGQSAEREAVIQQLKIYLRDVSGIVGDILERQDPPRPSTRIVAHAITTMYDQIGRWYAVRSEAQNEELIDTYWTLTKRMLRLS